ncbi:MAG: pentapeptide repeat-containing protein [Microcoleaceae cyanobacterium]
MSRDALVVGINYYEDKTLQLTAPVEDAKAIAKRLQQDGNFKVRTLLATSENSKILLTQLEDALIRLFQPGGNQIPDTALFYFSGHGLQKKKAFSEGFLATSDVYPDAGLYGLRLQWLQQLLIKSQIKQQIIWLDCCHSGEFRVTEANPKDQGQARDRCFIAASRQFEPAYEGLNTPYSAMTKVLLEGLDPTRYPDSRLTNYTLTTYIDNHLKNTPQRPIFTNFGEVIELIRPDTTPVAKPQISASDICPYKGLEFFTEEDHEDFYGRTQLTDKLLAKVSQTNFLAVLGASGSGKSSILRAGLLYQLKLGQRISGSDQWRFYILRPGEHPLDNLALAFLDPALSNIERATQLHQAKALIQQGAKGLQNLVQATSASRVVLIIDQFEEVFNSPEKEQFFECILEGNISQLCIIIAMRADFFGKCVEAEYSGLAKRIQDNQIIIIPMNTQELETAIAQPAKGVGLEIETELTQRMIADVDGSPGSLPLLQYTLTELWKQRQENRLQLTTYQQLGGVGGTLDKRATAVYNQLNQAQQAIIRHIFLSLTQLGEGTEDTRRRVMKSDLITAKHSEAVVDTVIQKLAQEKLLVTSDPGITASSQPQGVEVVDVPHEALIRHWKLLRQWLSESRDHLRKKRQIEAAAADWRNHQQAKDYLLQGKRLQEAREFQRENAEQFPLSKQTERLIQASVRSRRNNRVKLASVLMIPVMIVIAIVEPPMRQARIDRIISMLRTGEGGIRELEYLVEGCDVQIRTLLPKDLANFLFGNCVDLTSFKFSQGLYLVNANLRDASLVNANLRDASLVNANLRDASLRFADLRSANLGLANLRDASLVGANLRDASLRFADLRFADLRFANLGLADLRNANLGLADLRDAKLGSANLRGADFTEDEVWGKVKNLTPEQIKSACYWQEAKFDRDFQKQLESSPDPETPPDCSFWEDIESQDTQQK